MCNINLDAVIASLDTLFDSLNQLRINPPGPTLADRIQQRIQATAKMARTNERLLALHNIRDNRAAAQVVVNPPTQQEIDKINNALAVLSTVVQQQQTFDEMLATATVILDASKTISDAL